jgi:hypothetical protein
MHWQLKKPNHGLFVHSLYSLTLAGQDHAPTSSNGRIAWAVTGYVVIWKSVADASLHASDRGLNAERGTPNFDV